MIKDLFKAKKPLLSFEVFPPKKEEEFTTAFQTLDALSILNPDFISVTYGAGGSKSKKTIEIASYIQNHLHIQALAHLTCVGSRKEDIVSICKELKNAGVSNVLALRGDRPQYMTDEQYRSREFTYASELIGFLKNNTDLEIASACYPEKHFESLSLESDLVHLKEKETAGTEFYITQMFFDNESFYRFQERAFNAGIKAPICTGIMPITSSKQLGTTVSLTGSSIPKQLSDLIANYGDDAAELRKAGIDYAIRQIRALKTHGVDGVHLYTMNKAKMAAEIVSGIS